MKPDNLRKLVKGIGNPAVTLLKAEGQEVSEDTLEQFIQKRVESVLDGKEPVAEGVPAQEVTLTKSNQDELPDVIKETAAQAFELFKAEQEGDDFAARAAEKFDAEEAKSKIEKANASDRAPLRSAPINGTPSDEVIAKSIEMAPLSKYAQRPENVFSLTRLIKAISTGDWERARIEKALSGQIDEHGGYTVPDVVANELIGLLRERVIVQAAGARIQPMTSDTLSIPVLKSGTSTFWRGLQGSSLQESTTPTFNLAKLVAKQLTGLLPIPNELLDDSSLNMENVMMSDLADAIAEGEDTAWLVGDGTDEPIGIANYTGVTTVSDVNLSAMDIDTIRNLLLQVRLKKSKATAILTHPSVTDQFESLKDANGRPLVTQDVQNPDQKRAHGLPIFDSVNAVDADGKFVLIAAPMQEIRIGERSAVEIDADRSVGFKENVTWIRGIRRTDLTIGRPETVAVQKVADA